MRSAGVRRVQPGIESLSSRVLSLMRKGVTAAQNVHFLVSCRQLGIQVDWNILWGFPGERDDDYQVQIDQLGHLVHLEPPQSAGRVWLERYSPLYAEQVVDKAQSRLRPRSDYAAVYPTDVDLDELAYFFESDVSTEVPDKTYAAVATGVEDWRRRWACEIRPRFTMWRTPDVVHLEDTRDAANPRTHVFEGPSARLVGSCESPLTARQAAHALGLQRDTTEVEDALRALADRGVLFRDGPRYVLLAVPAEARIARFGAEEET
jgi:hypothetical protein